MYLPKRPVNFTNRELQRKLLDPNRQKLRRMQMQKIGFSLQSNYPAAMPEVLTLLRAVGFDAVSPPWQRGGDLSGTVDAALRCGLTLQSLHGPLRGLDKMWNRDAVQSTPILEELLCAADDCATYGFPLLVVHAWTGLDYTFRESALCFDNFDRLVERAQKNGIRIAFENLEGPEYLAALLERYRDTEAVGLCWDSGHELCYAPNWDFLKEYGHRLLMTHLNDNLGITHPEGRLQGTDDLHLLPYDGIAHWSQILGRLKQAKPQEILNFELKIRPKGDRCTMDLYSQLPLEQYFAEAYARACRAVSE